MNVILALGQVRCAGCGKGVNHVSNNGLCSVCVANRILNANNSLRKKRGAIHKLWKNNLRASVS